MGTRDHAVVDRELIREVPSLGHPDRVDVADQIRNGRVGGRELLAVALVRREPGDRCGVTFGRDQITAASADRTERMIVHLAAGDGRDGLVKEVDDRANEPGLRLAALAQEDQIVPREDAPFETGQDRVVESEDPREELLAELEPVEEVGAELLLDGAVRIPGGPEFAESGRLGHADQGSGVCRYDDLNGARAPTRASRQRAAAPPRRAGGGLARA